MDSERERLPERGNSRAKGGVQRGKRGGEMKGPGCVGCCGPLGVFCKNSSNVF